MDITRRINLLKSAAKKTELKGKKSRKDISKHLEKAKASYKEAIAKMKSTESEIARLTKIMEETSSVLNEAKEQITSCHKLLKDMDFMGADYAKVGKDINDVMFAVDKRWVKKDSNSSDDSEEDGMDDMEDLIHKAKNCLSYCESEEEALEKLCKDSGKSKGACKLALQAAKILLKDHKSEEDSDEECEEDKNDSNDFDNIFKSNEGFSLSR